MSGSAAPFWEMLKLLALEPGMEWLERGLAWQGAPWRAAGSSSGTEVAAGRELGWAPKHSLGPWPLKTLLLLECSGSRRLWQACLEGLKKFLDFRKSMGMPAAWPIPEGHIRGFLAVESLYSASKTLMYMAALSYVSRLTGHPGPLEDPLTRCMVLGLGRRAGILRDRHSPITIEVLRSLLGALESVCLSRYECLLFRALFTVAFFGALRIEEMVAKHRHVLQPELLFLCDLQLTERVAVFCLRRPHACQERPVIRLGLSGEPWVCPVLALHSYVRVRPRWDGPLFVHSIGMCVTRRELVAVLRDALRRLGLRAEHYGVHSFWLGTAVTTLRCGYSREQATRLARWPCALPCRPRPGGPAAVIL